MKTSHVRWTTYMLAAVTWATLSAGCVMSDGGYGYGYDGGGTIGASYYESYGVDYGGWGPGYHVAPYRGGPYREGGEFRQTGGGGHPGGHAYRSAPVSRSIPSLPRGNSAGLWSRR